mmetsp:Transcript_15588/g.23613  ORF Transcript_15588/g.23613 Transcript_15588/m.23613 type:complete len:108 (+) Transcript_15588:137-460(+)
MNLSFVIHTLVLFLPAIQGQFLLKDDESTNINHNDNKYDKPPIQQLQPRIIGGNPSKPNDHSFMVSWHWYLDLFPACGEYFSLLDWRSPFSSCFFDTVRNNKQLLKC